MHKIVAFKTIRMRSILRHFLEYRLVFIKFETRFVLRLFVNDASVKRRKKNAISRRKVEFQRSDDARRRGKWENGRRRKHRGVSFGVISRNSIPPWNRRCILGVPSTIAFSRWCENEGAIFHPSEGNRFEGVFNSFSGRKSFAELEFYRTDVFETFPAFNRGDLLF